MPAEKRLNLPIIEDALEEQGMTQTALAEFVGKSKQAVSKWLKGQSFPRPPELLKLSLALKVGYKQLFEIIAP
jgi:transcriptional regulator with XRE-family HTH domain